MTETFEIRVVVPCCIAGKPVDLGIVQALPAVDAEQLLLSGRGALVNEADRPRLNEALRRELHRALGQQPAPWGTLAYPR